MNYYKKYLTKSRLKFKQRRYQSGDFRTRNLHNLKLLNFSDSHERERIFNQNKQSLYWSKIVFQIKSFFGNDFDLPSVVGLSLLLMPFLVILLELLLILFRFILRFNFYLM